MRRRHLGTHIAFLIGDAQRDGLRRGGAGQRKRDVKSVVFHPVFSWRKKTSINRTLRNADADSA